MKQRRRLLFGLGILVSLSMAVPAYAADATQGTAQVSESVQEVLQDEENVEVPGTENEEGGTVDAADPTDGQDENSNGQQADSEDAATAAVKSGWQQIAANTWIYYDQNGNRDYTKTGMQTIGDKVYYLDENGVAQSGTFLAADGKEYVFDAEKGTATLKISDGWNEIDGKWYWYQNGKPYKGWLQRFSGWYYLKEDGTMTIGWYEVKGVRYYFDENGTMVTGWVQDGENWYYMSASGAMQTGWVQTHTGWYYLGNSGVMQTGWYVVNGKWYYSNAAGTMQTGWVNDGKHWYYMNADGVMQTDWVQTHTGWYYLGNSGVMQTGWYVVRGHWYYSNAAGTMQTGWVNDGKNWYYTDSNGAMQTGWLRNGGGWYYLKSSGAMATGWNRVGSYKYYFNGSGAMLQDLDSVLGRQSSYYITVNRRTCQVMVYAKSETGRYDIPVKTFACSVGLPATPTPTGTYNTLAQYRWHTLMGPSYGQYCTRIVGGVLFHSVAGNSMTVKNLNAANYNMLGQPASHGCVRLCVRDAKWIYDNCGLYTTVLISDTEATPFDRPATIKIPAGQNWDPTDQEALDKLAGKTSK